MCETPRWEAAHAGGQVWEARGRPPDGPGRAGKAEQPAREHWRTSLTCSELWFSQPQNGKMPLSRQARLGPQPPSAVIIVDAFQGARESSQSPTHTLHSTNDSSALSYREGVF